ncbi:MAG: EAL domain-containing protein [Actinomycetes bacterium]
MFSDASQTLRGRAAADGLLAGYRLLAENATDAVFLVDPDGVFTWASPATARVLGHDPLSLVGTNGSDLVHPDDRAGIQSIQARIEAGGNRVEFEVRELTATGEYRWMSGIVARVPFLESVGDRRIVTLRDIHEQMLARQDVQLLWDKSVDLLAVANLDGYLTSVNASWERVLGYSPQEITSMPYLDLVHPDDLEATLQKAQDLVEPGQVTTNFVVRCRRKDGTYRWLDWSSRTAEDGGRVFCVARDVTEEVLAQRTERMRHQLLAENASDVVWQVAPDGRLEWVSQSVTSALGWDAEALAGRFVIDLFHPDDRAHAVDNRAKVLSGGTVATEYRILCANGSFLTMAIRRRAVDDGGGVEVATLRDIQAEVDTREQLAHATEHDPLTGLATLPVAVAYIERLLDERAETGRGSMMAVFCVGVDFLKSINDALTYAGGDQILKSIASRIAGVAQNRDLLTRGSGDEFVLVISDLASIADARAAAERIRLAAKGPLTIDAHHVDPTVSVGVAMGGSDSDAGELVRDANLAMRQAKTDGRDRHELFHPRMAKDAELLLAVESSIREGLADWQFVPWFQPIVNLADGALVGYEALVRRVRPDGTVVEPDEFLPIAERSNLIIDLDLAVLQQSVEMLTRLPAPLHVAANLSATTLASAGYAAQVIELVNGRDIDPTRLHLELTETALLNVTDAVREVMCDLADAGVSWYVDDFGTGYSSIAHLRDLPIAGLKLDLSFTAGLGSGDLTTERLAQGLAGLADGLGLDTVAEGVETQAQAAILRAQGWRHGQGWLYGRPAPLPGVPQQPTEPS